jgi:lipoprotein-anchoring transpeptidase ErfK/SrfK
MRAIHSTSLPVALLLGWTGLTVSAPAAVYKENIDVPLQVTPARKGLFGRPETGYDSPIPSERYYASKEGKARTKKTSGQQADGSYRIITYRVPEVLREASARNTELVIDIGSQRAFLLVNGRIGLETPVSTARSGKFTPTGTFAMTERVRTGKVSNLYDVEMPYWMRLNTSEFGVHAGYLPGYPASAGCIRLPQDAAQLIFDKTRPGTRVRIHHSWRPSILAQPAGSRPAPAAPSSPRPGGRNQSPTPAALPVDALGQTFGRIQI